MSVSALAADPESHSYLKLVPGLVLCLVEINSTFFGFTNDEQVMCVDQKKILVCCHGSLWIVCTTSCISIVDNNKVEFHLSE